MLTTRDQKMRLEHILIPYRILAWVYDVTYEEAFDQSPLRKKPREFGYRRTFLEPQLVQLT
jgi:hypothetical protein